MTSENRTFERLPAPEAPAREMSQGGDAALTWPGADAEDGQTITITPNCPPHWPHDHNADAPPQHSALPAYPAEIERRLAPCHDRATITNWCSASELQAYVECPYRHQYRYRNGLSETSIRRPDGDLSVAALGSALHDYLARHEHSWSEAERRAALGAAVRQHARLSPDAAVQRHVDELAAVVNRYRRSEWHRRVSAAEERHREQPFYFEIDDVRLSGAVDVLLREGDSWTAIDYKTTRLGSPANLNIELVEAAGWYEVQAAVYALAAEKAGRPLRQFAFYFTEPGAAVAITVTPAWLRGWRERILAVAHRLRRGLYGGEPTWAERRCGPCEYVRICRPVGAPPELTRPLWRGAPVPTSTALEPPAG